MRIPFSAVLLTLSATAALAFFPMEPDADQPVIRGRFVNASGNPVAGAIVVVCDASSGLPLCGESWESFDEAMSGDAEKALTEITSAITNDLGVFVLPGAHKGTFKLMAQKWLPATQSPESPGPLEVNGPEVTQIAGPTFVTVADATGPEVTLRATGGGELRVSCNSGNSETLLLVSTKPTIADPVLGFSGWNGQFVKHAIAWNRMPNGHTRFSGLPEGKVYLTMFSADNNPGFGQAEAELRDGWVTEVEIPWLATWSDGMHLPPASIAEVQDRLRQHDLLEVSKWMALLEAQGVNLKRPESPLQALSLGLDVIEARVELPDNDGEIRVGEAFAAVAYAAIARQLEAQGRVPNPHREAAVRMHLAVKPNKPD